MYHMNIIYLTIDEILFIPNMNISTKNEIGTSSIGNNQFLTLEKPLANYEFWSSVSVAHFITPKNIFLYLRRLFGKFV